MISGGRAKRTSEIKVARPARPKGPNCSEPIGPSDSTRSTANTGTARPTLDTLTARNPPRRRCPAYSASGSPIAIATISDVNVSSSCWTMNVPMPVGPDQLAPSVR